MNEQAETVGEIAVSAAGWLAGAVRPDDPAHRSSLARALGLAELCRLVQPKSVSAVADLVSEILERITVEDLIATELLTALLAAAAIVRTDAGSAPGVFAYLGMLEDLVGAALDDTNGVLARMALRGEGAPRVDPAEPLTCGEAGLLRLDGSGGDQVFEQIEVRSAYGTIDARGEAPLTLMIEGTAMGAFRRYDLPRGMRALRARCYLDPSWSLGLESGFAFIRTSACADGSFGDYDGATIALREAGRPAELLELKLPVTFQALWTLAEVDDCSFRLAARAFPGGLLRKGQQIC
jgi:hypothetical protein